MIAKALSAVIHEMENSEEPICIVSPGDKHRAEWKTGVHARGDQVTRCLAVCTLIVGCPGFSCRAFRENENVKGKRKQQIMAGIRESGS